MENDEKIHKSGSAIFSLNNSKNSAVKNIKVTATKLSSDVKEQNLDDIILIFEEQIKGWKFDIIEKLLEIEHSSFVILDILMSYYEMVGKLYFGFTDFYQSKQYFEKGFKLVYPNLKENEDKNRLIDLMYIGVRCGIYHTMIPSPYIIIQNDLIEMKGKAFYGNFDDNDHSKDELIICPELLFIDIRNQFEKYIIALKDINNQSLRDNFEKVIRRNQI